MQFKTALSTALVFGLALSCIAQDKPKAKPIELEVLKASIGVWLAFMIPPFLLKVIYTTTKKIIQGPNFLLPIKIQKFSVTDFKVEKCRGIEIR